MHTVDGATRTGMADCDARFELDLTEYVIRFCAIIRRAVLDRIVRVPPSERELEQNIEALRVLDLGFRAEALFVPNVTPTMYEDQYAFYD